MSITVDISEELLAEMGREEVEKEMQEAVKRLGQRQRQAKGERLFTKEDVAELLHDLDEIDLSNDPAYQKAREDAWAIYTQVHNLMPDGRRKH